MKHTVLLTTPLVLILVGCGSFNNSFNSYSSGVPKIRPANASPQISEEHITSTVTATTQLTPILTPPIPTPKLHCDVNPFAIIPPSPLAPIKEIQDATDLKTIERLERKYLNDLVDYISEIRRRQKRQQILFLEKCETVGK